MSTFWKVVGGSALVTLMFDAAASFASLGFGFPYSYASAGSFLIDATVGYLIFRNNGLIRAIAASLLVEVVDATLGWFISWKIGPGAIQADQATATIIVTTIIFVLVFAAISAIIGSAIARALHGPRTSSP